MPRTVNGPDGPLQFPDSMSDAEVLQVMRQKYPPQLPHQTWQTPFPNSGMAGTMQESLGRAPARPVPMGAPPRVPRMTTEPTLGDYFATAVNAVTDVAPGAESAQSPVGTEAVTGARRLATPGQRLSGAAQMVGAAGEAITPLMGPALFGAPEELMSLGTGLALGTRASRDAETVARKLNLSPGAQELASQLGFWIPTGVGTIKGAMGGGPSGSLEALGAKFEALKGAPAIEKGEAPIAATGRTEAEHQAAVKPDEPVGAPPGPPAEPVPPPKEELATRGPAGMTPPPEEPGTRGTQPKTGEPAERPPSRQPDKGTMEFRYFKKLEYSQRALEKAIDSGDKEAIDKAHQQVLTDVVDWARYTSPETINSVLRGLATKNEGDENAMIGMRQLAQDLMGGKASFYSTEGSRQVSRQEFQQVAGTKLPPVPKDFVSTLPPDVAEAISGMKGRALKEATLRYWGASVLTEKLTDTLETYQRNSDIAGVITKAKGIKPESIDALSTLPKTTQVAERAGTPAPEPTATPGEAAQATVAPTAPGKPVESAEVTGEPTQEPPSRPKEGPANYFKSAQDELRKSLKREPAISEIVSKAADMKSKAMGVQDEVFESRVQQLMKKGMARGSAERIAREAMDKERGSFSLRRVPPTIGPQGPPPQFRLARLLDGLAHLTGERDPEEQMARNVTRSFAADLALKHLQLEARLKEHIDRHDADGPAEFRAFMDAGEGKIAQGPVNYATVGLNSAHPNAPHMSTADAVVAQDLHDMTQERWAKIQAINDKEPGGIENYLAHLWERPGMAGKTMARLFGKRPVGGKAGFLRERFYEYASDGLDAGLTPITWNPIRLQLTNLFQMDKFLAAHDLKAQYKAKGLVQWFRNGEDKPADWVPLNDKIFQPKIMEEPGKLADWGKYYAPPDVAKIFNRYVSPGLRGDPTYDAIRSYANTLNQFNLGLSAYHGLFITGVSGASDVALGLEKIINNRDFKGGLKDIISGQTLAVSVVRNFRLGKALQSEAINPTGNARLQAYVESLVDAGARFDQDPLYETSGRKFYTALSKGHIIEAAQSGIQTMSKPIMKYYVPRIKLGMAARMMEAKVDQLLQNGVTDQETYANEMGKIWDSVDNRAGQMVYDNLFWDKTKKDLAFLTIRAVGWNYGSAREFGGALQDVLTESAKGLRGEKMELTHRMAFTAGITMTMGAIGALTTYIATGHGPRSLEDYFFPPTGNVNANGKPERISYPSYMKDVYSFWDNPARTGLAKLNPWLGQLADLYQNHDYYNTEIRSPGDPWYYRRLDDAKYLAESALPFSASAARHRMQQDIPWYRAIPESFVGIMPAPAYITDTRAEQLTLEYAKRHWQAGPITHQERAQRDQFNLFRNQLAHDRLDMQAVGDALRSGKLREQDLSRLVESRGLSPFQSEFKSITDVKEALDVMRVATPEEREQLKPLLIDKIPRLEDQPFADREYYYKQIQQYLQ